MSTCNQCLVVVRNVFCVIIEEGLVHYFIDLIFRMFTSNIHIRMPFLVNSVTNNPSALPHPSHSYT